MSFVSSIELEVSDLSGPALVGALKPRWLSSHTESPTPTTAAEAWVCRGRCAGTAWRSDRAAKDRLTQRAVTGPSLPGVNEAPPNGKAVQCPSAEADASAEC